MSQPVQNDRAHTSTKVGGVLVLLCTYNERENILLLLDRVREAVPECDVLVVDDRSPDGTGELVAERGAEDQRIHLLSRPNRLGLGAATRQGLQYAVDHGYQFVVNLDADLSHDPAVIPQMLDLCRQGAYDVVVGSRYLPGGSLEGLPWYRRLISRMLNAYVRTLLRLPVSDCSGSYRCYRVNTLRKIDLNALRCNGYGFLEEILVALRKVGARFGEVPISFRPRQHGSSKLRISDALGAIGVINRLAFQQFWDKQ